MKKTMLLLLSFFFFPYLCFAEDYYVTNLGAGLRNGKSLDNAFGVAEFNTAMKWGNPKQTGKIGPGDTVYLSGTISSSLRPQGSGSIGTGNAITIKFNPGAKLSKNYWGADASAAIAIISKNYITIDGNNVGIVECTDNGTALTNQQDAHGINIQSCTGCEVKNLTIQNIYVRIPDSHDSNRIGKGITAYRNDSLKIHHNTINNAELGVYSYSGSVSNIGLDIYYNDISKVATGVVVALNGPANYSEINIYNNKIYDGYVWDGCWSGGGIDQCAGGNWNHNDGIHTWGNYSGYRLGPIKIFNNEIGGDFGAHTTGWIYLTDYTYPAIIYNNLLYTNAESPTNGYIAYHSYSSSGSLKIYNNTIKGSASKNSGGNDVYITGSGVSEVDIKNNIFTNSYIGIYDNSPGAIITSDYNIYYNVGNIGRRGSTWHSSLTSWQTALGGCPRDQNECSSITKDPLLALDYTIPYNSPAKDKGTNLSSIFTTDKTGFTRYRGFGWDIGAYEYNKPEPPLNLKIK